MPCGVAMVVVMQPLLSQCPDFLQAVEHVAVEDCRAVSPIESLDVGVLGRLAWPDWFFVPGSLTHFTASLPRVPRQAVAG